MVVVEHLGRMRKSMMYGFRSSPHLPLQPPASRFSQCVLTAVSSPAKVWPFAAFVVGRVPLHLRGAFPLTVQSGACRRVKYKAREFSISSDPIVRYRQSQSLGIDLYRYCMTRWSMESDHRWDRRVSISVVFYRSNAIFGYQSNYVDEGTHFLFCYVLSPRRRNLYT